MAKTKNTNVGMSASLKPKLLKSVQNPKKSKVYGFTLPKLGRFAFTRDPGEAGLFSTDTLKTHLGAILRGPDYSRRGAMHLGPIIDEYDLGSGMVTTLFVTALANDPLWTKEVAAENLAAFTVCKWMDWGIGTAAAHEWNFKLETKEENNVNNKEAIEATQTLKWISGSANAKLIVEGTLEAKAAGPVAITEWGLFSAKLTEGSAQKAATSTSATEIKDTAKIVEPKAASAVKVRGAQLYTAWAKEAEEVTGLVLKNTEEVITVPGWNKVNEDKVGATPAGTTKYTTFPLMADRRVFAAINVEKGNKISFPYEIEIQSKG